MDGTWEEQQRTGFVLIVPMYLHLMQSREIYLFPGTYDTPGASHVGIYVGNNMMIHCGNPIQYTSIASSYWQQHLWHLADFTRRERTRDEYAIKKGSG